VIVSNMPPRLPSGVNFFEIKPPLDLRCLFT
jgi:hypothetical protein